MEKMLEIKHLKKSFGTTAVIRDISFDVEEGEVLSIIGPSGSGKSTILRCINQLEKADGGLIRICGRTLCEDGAQDSIVYADRKEAREIGLNIGLVFQNFNLFPHFNVLRNITEAQCAVLGRSKADAQKKALMLLAQMGLEEKANAYPCELSGGQQQRVSIARALALDPKMLFFDEPTSALDPELTGEILSIIKELAKAKMTMIVVTHEMAFARDISNHIIFMDNGIIVEEGTGEEVINNPHSERTQRFLSRFSK